MGCHCGSDVADQHDNRAKRQSLREPGPCECDGRDGVRTADLWHARVALRPARVTNDGIGISAAGMARGWHAVLCGKRATQHELQPMCAGILAGDQEGVDAAVLVEEEIADISLRNPDQELQMLPGPRVHRDLWPCIPTAEIPVV